MTEAEIAFLRARLDEDAASAWAVHDVARCDALLYEQNMAAAAADAPDCDCGYPARILGEVAFWRSLLRDYQAAPLDAVYLLRDYQAATRAAYGGTERETGFRLLASAALKAKIATYDGNPVTGEPVLKE